MAFPKPTSERPGRRVRLAIIAGAALWFTPLAACAQADLSTSLLLSVPRLASLVIGGDVSSLLTLTADGSAESAYDSGQAESAAAATTLLLSANDVWDLSARLGGAWSCPGVYDKNESDLYIRVTSVGEGAIQNGAADYVNLSGSDLIIVSGAAASYNNEVDVQTKVLLDWTRDLPGSYSITVTYTLTTHLP